MPTFDILKQILPEENFNTDAIRSMFDLVPKQISEHFTGNIAYENMEWSIGLIYGSSGTGKSSIAAELWKDKIASFTYKSTSIINDFEGISIADICQTFNSVGFSSPPSWLKPYSVLSNGEKMRVDLARTILSNSNFVVFDEFTSVVDRTVAKIGSAALSKAIKRTKKKIIVISCHSDILEWLEPDWTFCTDNMQFTSTKEVLHRPKLKIDIYSGERKNWELFRKYHYLNTHLNKAASTYTAYIDNIPIAFIAILPVVHPYLKNCFRCSRLVVRPDYQGLGIGKKFLDAIANRYVKDKKRFRIITSNRSLILGFEKDLHWIHCVFADCHKNHGLPKFNKTISFKRLVTSWEYVDKKN